jgi:tetratricopeptide (TPR) repeat protein
MWQWTETGLTRAVEHLERGLGISGENALLLGALAYVYYQHANLGIEPAGEYRERARAFAERAFAVDPETPLAHLAIGLLSAFENPRAGIRSFKRVLAADPLNVEALVWLAAVTGHAWRPEVGRAYAASVRRLDPLHPMALWLDGYLLILGGEFDQGERVLREGLLSSRDLLTRWFLAVALAYRGRREEACALFDESRGEDPSNALVRIGTALRHALAGDRESAWEILRSDLDVSPTTRGDFAYALWVADCHALLGDTEGALDWLERSVSLGLINYPFLSVHDPFLEPLRADPRFQQLMERVKREWETFEV